MTSEPSKNDGGRSGKGPEHDNREVAQQDRDAESDENTVVALPLGGRAVERRQQRSFEQHRQRERQQHGDEHRQQRRDAEQRDDEIGEVAAHHVNFAMREVDDLQDREDHRQPGGDHGVDHADHQPVQRLDQDVVEHQRAWGRRVHELTSPRTAGEVWGRRPHWRSVTRHHAGGRIYVSFTVANSAGQMIGASSNAWFSWDVLDQGERRLQELVVVPGRIVTCRERVLAPGAD